MTLETVDIVLIFVYFVVLLGVGYFTSRKQNHEDFLIAERKLGMWKTMTTINASKFGSIFMSFVAMTYLFGFAAVWYFIGVVTGFIIFVPFAIKLKKKSEHRYYTLADYFKYNYGKGAGMFASAVSIILMYGLAVMALIAGTKIFVFFTGWSFFVCAIIIITIVLVYLALGGFRAVAKTDFIQYIAMILILVFLVVILFKGSIVPSNEWDLFSTDLFSVIGFFVVGILFPFASPELWQRIYSSKGGRELKRGLILSIVFYAMMAFLLTLLALTVKSNFPGVEPDIALIYGFGNLLPVGLVGLASVLLFSAIMSSLDTFIYTGTSSVVQDFFNLDKEKIVKNIKIVLVLATISIFLISILIKSLIVSTYLFVAFYAVLAVPVLATWIRKKIKQETLIFGFFVGFFGTISFLIISLVGEGVTPVVAGYAIASVLVGFGIGAIVSYFKYKK